jgi:hypothetical protein
MPKRLHRATTTGAGGGAGGGAGAALTICFLTPFSEIASRFGKGAKISHLKLLYGCVLFSWNF